MLFGFRVSPDRFCIGEHQLLLMLCELLRIFQRLHLPKAGEKIGVWHVGAIEQMRLVHVPQQQFQLLLVRIVITTNSETRIKSTFFTAAANAFTP